VTIVRNVCQHGALWHRLMPALILAIALCLVIAPPARAQDLADYFQISYDPVTFDKVEITGNEVFHATVAGRAVCTKDLAWKGLPIPVTEAVITSQVIAKHTTSGSVVTLNQSYTITIKPFPDRAGDTIEIDQTVPLQFATGAASGNYTVIGQIVAAEVKFFLGSMDVTEHLPREQPMGTVKYTAPDSSSVQVTTTPPSEATPPPSSPSPAANPEPAEPLMPWWVELIVFIAIATTVFNIAWFLRHRRSKER